MCTKLTTRAVPGLSAGRADPPTPNNNSYELFLESLAKLAKLSTSSSRVGGDGAWRLLLYLHRSTRTTRYREALDYLLHHPPREEGTPTKIEMGLVLFVLSF